MAEIDADQWDRIDGEKRMVCNGPIPASRRSFLHAAVQGCGAGSMVHGAISDVYCEEVIRGCLMGSSSSAAAASNSLGGISIYGMD